MTAAAIVASYLNGWCRTKFPGDGPHCGPRMASTMLNMGMADVFDHKGYGSHKYIPADNLSADLGLQPGSGVFGYWKMYDDSYVLRTSPGPLAHWSGKPEDKAEWGEFADVQEKG